jgi:hypothetical protein
MRKQGADSMASRTIWRGRTLAAAFLSSWAALAIAGAPATWAMKAPHVDGNGDIAVCEFSVHVNLEGNGLTVSEVLAGGSGDRTVRFASDRGISHCTGRVNGYTISGDGTAAMVGQYQASALCVRGVGTGTVTMSVPRLLTFFGQEYEALQGEFGLDLSGAGWRQLGDMTNEAGASSAFSALSRFTADAGSLCTERAGTLTGRLALGGTSSQRSDALSAAR